MFVDRNSDPSATFSDFVTALLKTVFALILVFYCKIHLDLAKFSLTIGLKILEELVLLKRKVLLYYVIINALY